MRVLGEGPLSGRTDPCDPDKSKRVQTWLQRDVWGRPNPLYPPLWFSGNRSSKTPVLYIGVGRY